MAQFFSSRERALFEKHVEALLHLLDGSSRDYVAKRYNMAEPYLRKLQYGTVKRTVRMAAIDVYDEYRWKQKEQLNEHRQP